MWEGCRTWGQPLSHQVAVYLVKYKYKSGIYLGYLIARKSGKQGLAITRLDLDNKDGQNGQFQLKIINWFESSELIKDMSGEL